MLAFETSVPVAGVSPASKRDRPHDDRTSKPKARAAGPFITDDSDSEEEEDPVATEQDAAHDEPSPKRRMLEKPDQDTVSLDLEAERRNAQLPTEHVDSRDSGPAWTQGRALFPKSFLDTLTPSSYTINTCTGRSLHIKERQTSEAQSFEQMAAARTTTKEGRAKRAYYGIDIHNLMKTAQAEIDATPAGQPTPTSEVLPTVEAAPSRKKSRKHLLWTEKYRAKNFMDLCGDDSTNRNVLRWLKRWDPVVFPGAGKAKPVIAKRPGAQQQQQQEEEKPHRKILMLTGPPGLGKTTLAHVCAKQAGYEVLEVNASDDRSRDVVKNRIRTSLGTESVKTVTNTKTGGAGQKPAKPVCVVVDEVDGVVTGSGGSGEGGFVKALIDLVMLDQKNTNSGGNSGASQGRKKKKGDDFRQMRPLSNLAEVIHVGRPSLDAVVGRLRAIFDKEAIPCDKDASRKLCEAAWGMGTGADAKKGAQNTVEGDLRGVMVVGEWAAGRFRAANASGQDRLTRHWIERHILPDLASGAAGARGLGRGSSKDIVSRIFQEGGGFPKPVVRMEATHHKHEQPTTELGFGEQQKKYSMERLREMVDTSGEIGYILAEIFAEYPNREFNDDSYLTKPNQAYDWLHFHDACQGRLYASQEWELAPYLGQPVLACHHFFASPKRHIVGQGYDKRWGESAEESTAAPAPFSGPRADYEAHEAEKHNRAQLQAIQAQLTPTLGRAFRSAEDVATEFLPYLTRIVSPEVKPVVVGGSTGSTATIRKESEKAMVKRAAEVLAEVGIALHKGKVEGEALNSRTPQYVYRMEPDLDALSAFDTASNLLSSQAPVRFAVRQVLDQELQRTLAQRDAAARQARFLQGGGPAAVTPSLPIHNKENMDHIMSDAKAATIVKKDFFGRVIEARPLAELDINAQKRARKEERKVWVTYHEGMNNAVRKPMSLQEFLRGL
ncbi:Chromosome transmission fidelity protein-like protein [Emericellopsis cladophorae]|uniref:Chromosome transmission fidelity protein-like protein n=1 Tax=Emericellopsis cladophorae TaxID=2686198 RepID=A0A9P9Y1I3_9HYPO|nr:Chromosome transmission fidelity protein-like protein [Emericellopsis cladophorae]KAI6781428.1 Chromosome transmission fidelity protein-like protein [Emericellopsis cladophorae]